MNHAQLKAFHAVAKHGGFTSAAKSLGLTQPAITLQVQALEKKYNTPLFIRLGRGVDLTSAGILLRRLSSRYFDLEEEIHSMLSTMMQLTAGKLRIASDMAPRVYPFTSEFRDKHPDIEIIVSICQRSQLEEDLLDHLVDIAFTGTKPSNPSLEYLQIGEEEITVTLPQGFPLNGEDAISLKDLSDQKVFIFEDNNGLSQLEKDLVNLAEFPPENLVIVTSRELVRESVAHNQGICFLSKREVSHDHRLKSIPIVNCRLKRLDYLAYHGDKRDTPLISAFRDIHSQK